MSSKGDEMKPSCMTQLTRRKLFALTGAALATPILRAAGTPPARTVALAKCATYNNDEVLTNLRTMFDQLGGLGKIVANKTVTVKLNLTGSPRPALRRPSPRRHPLHPSPGHRRHRPPHG